MRKSSASTSLLWTGLLVALLAGCSTTHQTGLNQAELKNESFTSTNVYSRSFPGSGASTCEAARRALLSQGYVINKASASEIDGSKKFQPERELNLQIEFHVVCASNSKGSNSATAFANAVQDSYALKKSSNSASIGVGALGSLSLPIGSVDESLVKVGSETISSPQFYDGFFGLVDTYVDGGDSPDSAQDIDVEHGPDKTTELRKDLAPIPAP